MHLSDLHFGANHICNPEDQTGSSDGIPPLSELIINDLSAGSDFCMERLSMNGRVITPLLLSVTGDFAQKADKAEFDSAFSFLNEMQSKPILGNQVKLGDIYMVPGNHDVVFDKKDADSRFQPYVSFYNRTFDGHRPIISAHRALDLTQIHAWEKDGSKCLIAEINCCLYVEKDTVDSSRGQVAMDAIAKLRKLLENEMEKRDFHDRIKIALLHHHIVLLPSLIEPGRGVDSILNGRQLLELLNEYGFHLILHGHKHSPQLFVYDPVSLWTENEMRIPQVVISGGSCGSDELPTGSINSCNTYGVIDIKWHPKAEQARIRLTTRGLQRKGPTGPLTPDRWKWRTINTSERIIVPSHSTPLPGPSEETKWETDDRPALYQKLRGQMPVVEVMPSLIRGQAYEAKVWIEIHKEKPPYEEELIKVDWFAGTYFSVQTATLDSNEKFCVVFQYWGPMMIQAKLHFRDGHKADAFVYARMPKKEY